MQLAQATVPTGSTAPTLNFYTEAVNQALPGADPASIAAADRGFGALVSRYLEIALVIAALLLLGYLVWGGIQWMTSGGDKSQVEKARNKITQAVVGMLVLLGSVALFVLLQNFFGFNVLNFTRSRTSSPTTGGATLAPSTGGGTTPTLSPGATKPGVAPTKAPAGTTILRTGP